jgi:hypothetical protein
VDKRKRREAIERGEEFTEELDKRAEARAQAIAVAAAAQAKPAAVSRLSALSRAGALITATFTLVAAVVSTLTRVELLQADIERLSGWDSFVETIRAYPVGAAVAFVVIGANIIAFVQKKPAKS